MCGGETTEHTFFTEQEKKNWRTSGGKKIGVTSHLPGTVTPKIKKQNLWQHTDGVKSILFVQEKKEIHQTQLASMDRVALS